MENTQNIGNNNNFGIDIQKYMSGTYSINNSKTTPIFVDTNKDINTNENPSNSSISSTYVYDIEREGDLTYPEDKEECIAFFNEK